MKGDLIMEFNITKSNILNTIPQTDKKEIRVTDITANGKDYIDIRQYYKDKNNQWLPGKGIWIPQDIAETVAEAILEALDIYHIDPAEDSDSQLDEQGDD